MSYSVEREEQAVVVYFKLRSQFLAVIESENPRTASDTVFGPPGTRSELSCRYSSLQILLGKGFSFLTWFIPVPVPDAEVAYRGFIPCGLDGPVQYRRAQGLQNVRRP